MSRDASVLLDIADALEMYAAGEQRNETPSVWHRLAEACQRAGRATRIEVEGGIRALDESSTSNTLLTAAQPQFPAFQQRRLFLRDVVPVVPTSTLMTPFVRELSPQSTELAASGVAEGTTKPDAAEAFSFQGISVDVGTLAANITVTSQLWKDTTAFAGYVSNQRLPYLLRLREEVACFQGNGEVVNGGITGVLHDSAVTSDAPGASLIATVASLAATVADQGAVADHAFVNAGDYFRTFGTAYSGGLSVQVLDYLPMMLPTLSIPSGTVVVGDFGNGAAIIDRETSAVEVYDQHSDYRIRNLELVQGEERVGWVLTLPWAFAYATGGSF